MSSRKRSAGPGGSRQSSVQQQQQPQTAATQPVEPQQYAPFFGGKSGGRNKTPDAPQCPDCKQPMAIKQITPVLFASELDDVLYKCDQCDTEVKRTIKRT